MSPDGRVAGRLRVKAGPIAAAFAGTAETSRDEATRSGAIAGAGRDARSASATRGRIRYALEEAPTGTAGAVEIGFTLTGPLAQFGRSGLVADVADRLTADFVRNLEARQARAADAAPAPAALDARAQRCRRRTHAGRIPGRSNYRGRGDNLSTQSRARQGSGNEREQRGVAAQGQVQLAGPSFERHGHRTGWGSGDDGQW